MIQPTQRILGIDPGTTATGWGIVEGNGHGKLRHISDGVIRTQPDTPLAERLHAIFLGITEVVGQHQPVEAAIEAIFLSQNVQSALKLGHARGVAMVAVSAQGIHLHEYSALEVKKAVVGYGRAEKSQVQEMIRLLLALPKARPRDASDALAVAVCHLHHSPMLRRTGRAGSLLPSS